MSEQYTEQEQFEAWCKENNVSIVKYVGTDIYVNESTQVAWKVWNARAQQPEAEQEHVATAKLMNEGGSGEFISFSWRGNFKPVGKVNLYTSPQPAQPVVPDGFRMNEDLKAVIRDYRQCSTRELEVHMHMIERMYIDSVKQLSAAPAQEKPE